MKLKRYFISAALLLSCVQAFCCGPYWYSPESYYLYRVYDKESYSQYHPEYDKNCERWKAIAGPSVTVADIREVVYKWSLDQLNGILSKKKSKNSFARWIASERRTDVADFLVLAKRCELARAEMVDPWYYPAKDDEVMASLREIISEAISYDGADLEDRYVLQAVRAMFSLKEYSQIDSLWNARQENIKDGPVRDLALGYVAGAAFWMGDKGKAISYYAACNDLESMALCLGGGKEEVLEYAAKNCPDIQMLPKLMQEVFSERNFLNGIYDSSYEYNYEYNAAARKTTGHNEINRWVKICLDAASRANDPGIWYYTAAYLKDLDGRHREAYDLAVMAEKNSKAIYMAESSRVLRMCMDAKVSTYDGSYESRLLSDLRWLDSKITGSITPAAIDRTSHGWDMHIGISYYYWNDMMRKLLLGIVGPRLEDSGRGVLALRMLNMADNRLIGFVDKYVTNWYDEKWNPEEKVWTMAQYRKDASIENQFDYSSFFFDALDAMDLAQVKDFESSMGKGGSALERFLDERGYISHDYVKELIGTRLIRERRYPEAVKYLSDVSSSYESTTNVSPYFRRNPFAYGNEKFEKPVKGYKLSFAREMASLETKMKSSDADERGSAMLKYGLGLRSSFDYCWVLTQYHLNCDDEWKEAPYRMKALSDAENYIRNGLRTIADPEKAAKAYASVCLWRTALEKFPQTKTAAEIREQCDQLKDYKFVRSNR